MEHLPVTLLVLRLSDRRRQQRHDSVEIIPIPDLLSLLATNHLDGEVQGMNQLQAQDVQKYGPGDYVPDVFIQYWSMRVMAYIATLVFLMALWGPWLLRRRQLATSRWFLVVAVWAVIAPFLMNAAGWMLTENGRQPWIVQGLMKTANGVSPSVSATDIWITLWSSSSLYITLGVADAVLMIRYARRATSTAPSTVPSTTRPMAASAAEDEPPSSTRRAP